MTQPKKKPANAAAAKAPVNQAPQICYLLQQEAPGCLVKIGITADVIRRMKQITAGAPFNVELKAIIGGGCVTEREFKALFKALRVKGEWYRPDEKMNEWLLAKRDERRLLSQRCTDPEFLAAYVAPVALSYLAGREANNNYAGDLVLRLLAGRLPDGAKRAHELKTATQGAITLELAYGYVPEKSEDAFQRVQVPALHALRSGVAA